MRTKRHIIPANGSTGAVGAAGNIMTVEYMSGPFKLRLGNKANIEITERKEIRSPRNWDQYELINETSEAISIILNVGETETITVTSKDVKGVMALEQGTSLNNSAPVTVDENGVLVAGSASRKGLHFRNASAAVIYLGGADVTVANAAIVLQPDEEWREESAADAAWYAITTAGASGDLAVMGLV